MTCCVCSYSMYGIKQINTDNPATVGGTRTLTTPTTAVCRGTPTTVVSRGNPTTPTTPTAPTTPTTPTTPATVTTPPGNTEKSSPTPSGPQGSSTDHANMQLQPDGKYPTLKQHKNRKQAKSKECRNYNLY